MSRQLANWLDSYVLYQDHTENPTLYNLWAGIGVLSSALKRNVKIWYHTYEIFPCQYIILVGPPGIGKGNAIKPAVQIAKEADVINFLSDRITAEKIIVELAAGFLKPKVGPTGGMVVQDHSCCILAKELPVFLGSSDWMHSLLCQLWDEYQFEHQTKNKGSSIIKDLCVSLLGGCVPDFIRSLTKERMAAITGGFTSRCMFIYESKKPRFISDGWGKPNSNRSLLHDQLVNDLNYISNLSGEFTLTPEARQLWDSSYADFHPKDDFESDVLVNFKSRVPSHVIKAAMTFSVSESDNLVITERNLNRAIREVESVRDKVDITFRSVGESPLAAAQDRVLRFIQARGIATRGEILKYNYRHITDEQLDSILTVLIATGFISEQWTGTKVHYVDTNQVSVSQVAVQGGP